MLDSLDSSMDFKDTWTMYPALPTTHKGTGIRTSSTHASGALDRGPGTALQPCLKVVRTAMELIQLMEDAAAARCFPRRNSRTNGPPRSGILLRRGVPAPGDELEHCTLPLPHTGLHHDCPARWLSLSLQNLAGNTAPI